MIRRFLGDGLLRFLRDAQGATAIEYALLGSGIAVAIAATVFGVGDTMNESYFEKIRAAFDGG